MFFAYGSLPLYVVRIVGELVGRGSDVLTLRVISRALSALASTASILWAYLIAARVADRRAGLLAAESERRLMRPSSHAAAPTRKAILKTRPVPPPRIADRSSN